MQCPACKDVILVMADRQGVEIDYCPQCRGVWLDRGELDKIIERSASLESSSTRTSSTDRESTASERRGYKDDYQHKHRHKKKGFLGDFFDFE
jgi:uncharacterized protein